MIRPLTLSDQKFSEWYILSRKSPEALSLFDIQFAGSGRILTFHDLARAKNYTYNVKNNTKRVQHFYLAAGEDADSRSSQPVRSIQFQVSPISSTEGADRSFHKTNRRSRA